MTTTPTTDRIYAVVASPTDAATVARKLGLTLAEITVAVHSDSRLGWEPRDTMDGPGTNYVCRRA